jgi:hypothetical protein
MRSAIEEASKPASSVDAQSPRRSPERIGTVKLASLKVSDVAWYIGFNFITVY